VTAGTIQFSEKRNNSLSLYIVDDDFLQVETLKSLLEKYHMPVCGESYDTVTAYREIDESRPEIIIADIRFGNEIRAGIDLVNKCRSKAIKDDRRIPFVIFITAFADVAHEFTSKNPFSTVLNKPVREADFKKALEIASSQVNELRKLRDAQWALKSLSTGQFKDLEGEFIGVFDQEVIATGNEESEVRTMVSRLKGVPEKEIVVEYKGEW
jgi:two-component SAPR family response regulator